MGGGDARSGAVPGQWRGLPVRCDPWVGGVGAPAPEGPGVVGGAPGQRVAAPGQKGPGVVVGVCQVRRAPAWGSGPSGGPGKRAVSPAAAEQWPAARRGPEGRTW